jgi:peroxiredoxin
VARRSVPVAVLLAALALAGCTGGSVAPESSAGDVRAIAPALVTFPDAKRRSLPAFAAETLAGGRLDLGRFRGQVLVLNFWASWCGPCRAEQAGLELASRQLAGRGVQVVGVDVRDDRVAATAFVDEFKVSYPSLYDKPGVLAARLGAGGPPAPPATLVVDRQGRVAARFTSRLPGDRPEAQAAFLADLVGRVAP